jgi:peptidoglycan/xylan/chitin deacetylase (PgdA/CDA1 family)
MKRLLLLALLSAIALANWNLYPTYPAYLLKQKDIVKDFYFRADTPRKIVALTFDDGPSKKTANIMAVLKAYNTPATFFLIAKKLNVKYDNLYSNKLFLVGMHTLNHKNFDKLSSSQIEDDFNRAIALFKAHNLNCTLFRPAYGVLNKRLDKALKKRAIKAILWSNDTRDWSKKQKSYKRAIDNLSSGDIILMHDHATSPKELKALIVAIRARGFKIVPLQTLLKYRSKFPI